MHLTYLILMHFIKLQMYQWICEKMQAKMIFLKKYYVNDKVLFMFNLYPFKMSLMIGNLSHWCLVCIHSQLISSLPIILSSNPVNTCYKRKLIFPRSIRKLRNKQWVEFKILVVFKFDLIWIKFENQLWHSKRERMM